MRTQGTGRDSQRCAVALRGGQRCSRGKIGARREVRGDLKRKGSWGEWGLRDWRGRNGKEKACQGAIGERAKPGRPQFQAGILRELLSTLMRGWGVRSAGEGCRDALHAEVIM